LKEKTNQNLIIYMLEEIACPLSSYFSHILLWYGWGITKYHYV